MNRRATFRPVGVMRRYERDADGSGWHDGLLMDLLAEELRQRVVLPAVHKSRRQSPGANHALERSREGGSWIGS